MDKNAINRLLDDAIAEMRKTHKRFGEFHLFKRAYGRETKKMRAALSAFLRDVTTCPGLVIEEAQRILAPKRSQPISIVEEQKRAA